MTRLPFRLIRSLAALAIAAGCAPKSEPALQPATPAAPSADGCATIREEFFADSLRRAETLPTPVLKNGRLVPQPVPRPYPRGVVTRRGAEFIVEVLVDTLGKADMTTFKVIKSTHSYLTRSLRTAFSKWTFEPATRRGCKVPRVFHYEGRIPGNAGR